MTTKEILYRIKDATAKPVDGYVAELHVQVIKYADELADVTGREFCEVLGIGQSFGTEFSKMKKIAGRLRAAGLDVDRL